MLDIWLHPPRGDTLGADERAAVLAASAAAAAPRKGRLPGAGGAEEACAFFAFGLRLAIMPGATQALWAAGAPWLRVAARGACLPQPPAASCVTRVFKLLAILSEDFERPAVACALKFLVAAGACRELALCAAAAWRACAAAGDAAAVAACTEGFEERHASGARVVDVGLVQCWSSALLAGACGDQIATGRDFLEEMAAAGSPGRELELADAYDALADEFEAAEGDLQEAFERDEAPVTRAANARAVAQHFGCGNLSCARTAGLSRADAKALFPAQRSRCLIARYCSAECQTADSRAGHKHVCRALAAEREAAAG